MQHRFLDSPEALPLRHIVIPEKRRLEWEALYTQIDAAWEGGPLTTSLIPQAPSEWEIAIPSSFYPQHRSNTDEGLKQIKKGAVAALIFAGGLGSRLGSTEPKGCFPLIPEQGITLFQILFEKISCLEKQLDISLPLILGLSSFTYEKTLAFFKRQRFFGKDPNTLIYLLQKDYPYFHPDGHICFDLKDGIPRAPCGNGSFVDALHQSSVLDALETAKITYLHMLNVDNPLDDPFDPYLVGEMVRTKADVGLLGVERRCANEKTGCILTQHQYPYKPASSLAPSSTHVIDYMELDRATAQKNPLANVGHYCMQISFLRKLSHLPLPLHFVPKMLEIGTSSVPVLKAEKFAMDLIPYASSTALVAYSRASRFAPLKQLHGEGGVHEVAHRYRATL